MKTIISAILFLAGFVVWSGVFVINEGEQALITQFGKIVGQPISQAGLYWKIPLMQDVRVFDKRILSWDGDPNQIPTKDKKYIIVDTTARWRISDPVLFAQTVQNESGVRARLDGILDGVTRDIISRHSLVEAVRNTNTILDRVKAKQDLVKAAAPEALPVETEEILEVEEEISGEIEAIQVGRERISDAIHERARTELSSLGIDLIDVQLRRIAYEASVEGKVFSRMISERQRIAEKIRSLGKAEEARIKGKMNRDLREIESNAYRKSEEIRGRADAEATMIYAESLGRNPDYYNFLRTLEAYKTAFADKGELIISTDSDFLNYLKEKK
jgi:membrane protease subunit HflC